MRNRIVFPLLFLLCCPILGCSTLGLSLQSGTPLTKSAQSVLDGAPGFNPLPRELSLGVLPDHILEPGDALLIELNEFDTDIRLPADQRVMADGRIDLGAFGRASVAGLTLEDAEQLITEKIAAAGHRQSGVNVRLLEPVHRFYVLGAVNSPGSFPLVGHETVLDGIVSAGGLSSTAAPCKILLARPTPASSCRVALPVCYHEITQLGDTTTNYQLRPGDRVFVASRSWVDELRFWESSHGCPRCQSCQCPCPDPLMAGHDPLMTSPMMAAPITASDVAEPGSANVSRSSLGVPNEIPESIGALQPSRMVESFAEEVSTPAGASDVPATSVPKSPPAPSRHPGGLPDRLPNTERLDGELDFESPPSDSTGNRFEPLWITPVGAGFDRPLGVGQVGSAASSVR